MPKELSVWELSIRLANDAVMSCLEEAVSADEAFAQVVSAWKPPAQILTFSASRKNYFQINIPSLTGEASLGSFDLRGL